jgi:hypothetical protein
VINLCKISKPCFAILAVTRQKNSLVISVVLLMLVPLFPKVITLSDTYRSRHFSAPDLHILNYFCNKHKVFLTVSYNSVKNGVNEQSRESPNRNSVAIKIYQ